jgi:diguanylate cyclase (GGDEF)-like protein/PAS domain S-box-containing protein
MRAAAQAFFALMTSSADALFTKTLNGTVLTWNRGAEVLYGYSAADMIGRNVRLLDPDTAGADVAALLKAVAAGETVQGLETVRRRRDGTMVDVSLTVSPVYDAGGDTVSASVIGRDITGRKRLEAQLARQVTHDDLTGLPNRALLEDRLAQALARSRRLGTRLGVLLVDVDRMTNVNAAHGYLIGDLVLADLASRLNAGVAEGDTVGRIGGDEFVVVCDETPAAAVEELATRLAAALALPIEVEGQRVAVTVSIGIAISPPLQQGALLRYAQAAMIDAKARGRARWHVFDADTEQGWNDRVRLGRELVDALADDVLELHYQPVVHLATGRLVGIEALLRWPHPTRGWVPPGLFVPLAEETGLIASLDEWVLHRACRQVASIRKSGVLAADTYLAVNLSARNLNDASAVEWVPRAVDASGFPLDALELEVTETGLIADAQAAGRVLRSLRELGIGIALDDFGTGYSSLTYLRRLPVSAIKIDREFVTHITDRSDDLAIVTSVIDLGRAVELRTIAEGVETPQQLAILNRLGCQAGQGYLWSPALPLEELTALLRGSAGFMAAAAPGTDNRYSRSRVPTATNEHGKHRIVQLHRQGASLATIAAALNAEAYRSPSGQRWHTSSVARVIADLADADRRKTQLAAAR